jgi:hypothetical protein
MKVLNFTVDVVTDYCGCNFHCDCYEMDYVVIYCDGEEVWRNSGRDYLGRGHGGDQYEYAASIAAEKVKSVFANN